jgi:hypothetical protein
MGGFALAGRTALLTGAGSGIGRASALERGRPLVPLGWERGTLWLKQLFPGLYERYNALLARRLLGR